MKTNFKEIIKLNLIFILLQGLFFLWTQIEVLVPKINCYGSLGCVFDIIIPIQVALFLLYGLFARKKSINLPFSERLLSIFLMFLAPLIFVNVMLYWISYGPILLQTLAVGNLFILSLVGLASIRFKEKN